MSGGNWDLAGCCAPFNFQLSLALVFLFRMWAVLSEKPGRASGVGGLVCKTC